MDSTSVPTCARVRATRSSLRLMPAMPASAPRAGWVYRRGRKRLKLPGIFRGAVQRALQKAPHPDNALDGQGTQHILLPWQADSAPPARPSVRSMLESARLEPELEEPVHARFRTARRVGVAGVARDGLRTAQQLVDRTAEQLAIQVPEWQCQRRGSHSERRSSPAVNVRRSQPPALEGSATKRAELPEQVGHCTLGLPGTAQGVVDPRPAGSLLAVSDKAGRALSQVRLSR
jgi:hypothetical protein